MDEKGTKKTKENGGSDMKKYCMIVKSESYYGITLMVDDDFDEDYDSLVLKKVLKDFPKESRRTIFLERDEVDMINEGDEIKIEPEFYLNKDGVVKSIQV
jgi:ABC-type phosphate/phosphonate transport system substrate-binding protein